MLLKRCFPALALLAAGSLIAFTGPVLGQDAPVPAEPTAVEAAPAPTPAPPAPAPPEVVKLEKPTVTPDNEILKRTPTIDGTIEEGEWDIYYTINAENWKATTYANWDDSGLCIAAQSDRPIDLTLILDASANGWYNGEENYQFTLQRSADNALNLVASRYDSKNSNSAAASPVPQAEAARVQVKSSQSNGSYMIEMKIPTDMVRGFNPANGRKTGIQVSVNATDSTYGWVPGDNASSITECTLVTKKIAVLKPLVLDLGLKNLKVARGDELVSKLYLTNEGTETVDVYSLVVAGEGRSGPYLSSQKVRVEGVAPKKHLSHELRTIIPSDMPLGSWAIGAEINSKSSRIGGALVSFDVVDPFDAELKLPSGDVRTDVKDVTFAVVINNNSNQNIRGISKITLPPGWELWKNTDTKEFSAHAESITSVAFKAKLPLGAVGNVPISVEVKVGETKKTVQGNIKLVNP